MTARVIGGMFLASVGVAEFITHRSFLLITIYGIASLVTFIFYALDKNAARKGAWRIPEAQLHLLSLIGGWPGAMIAQQTLRHKSKQASFRLVFRVTVVLNGAAAIWFFTPAGSVILNTLAGDSV